MNICVIVTVYRDNRVLRTISSLKEQTLKPDLVIIADGGSGTLFKNMVKKELDDDYMVFRTYPGSIARTRYLVMKDIIDDFDIIAFIDADEEAPSFWVEAVTEPIRYKEADFVGGITFPFDTEKTSSEIFVDNLERLLYEDIATCDISQIPMGNSAWHMNVFRKIGNFENDYGKYGLAEDYDINIRAIKSGFKGVLSKEAWLCHDHSRMNTFFKVFKSFYFRQIRTVGTYMKHKVSLKGATTATRRTKMFHPFQLVLLLSKPFAYITAWVDWNRRNKSV